MKKFLHWLKENLVPILLVTILLAWAVVMVWALAGSKERQLEKVEGLPNRFEILEEFDIGPRTYRVIKDMGTNVLYLVGPYDTQLLVDYKGDPVTWDPFGG